MRYTVHTLGQRYLGIEVEDYLGDLTEIDPESMPASQRDGLDFARNMKDHDFVLVVVHDYPFALGVIDSPYYYRPERKGIYFRHLRMVSFVRYYADYKTNPRDWIQTPMRNTISKLQDPTSVSYRLIEEWLGLELR